MGNDLFGGIKLTNLDVSTTKSFLRDIEINNSEMWDAVEEKHRKDEAYKKEVLETLKSIEANTVGLSEIVPLLSGSLEKQDEILEYLRGALAISASESPEEAEGKLRKMMAKATTLTTDIETIQKLNGFAKTVYDLYIKMYMGQ